MECRRPCFSLEQLKLCEVRMGVFKQCLSMLAPVGRRHRHVDWIAVTCIFVIPIICAASTLMLKKRIGNADIIVSGVGVLGGLLFAHAIFVFQLRMSYSDAKRRRSVDNSQPPMEKIAVPKMIDQMFYSVVYASGLSLFITLFVGMSSSFSLSDDKGIFPLALSSIIVFLIAHLAGWVWYVMSITVSAYKDLIKEL